MNKIKFKDRMTHKILLLIWGFESIWFEIVTFKNNNKKENLDN